MMHLLFPIAHAVTISVAIPGSSTNNTSSAPGAFVANFYQFALLIGGILAFGAIVFGGVKYVISAGNPSAQSDGKEWIFGALIGLLLLAGAYLILKVINPQLLNLSPATLNAVNVATNNTTPANSPTPSPTSVACGSQDANGNSLNGQCQNASNGSVNYCCNTQNSAFGMNVGSTWKCQSTPCQ